MSRKAPTSEEIVEIRRLLKLRLAQQSISQSAYLWEKEFWNAYIWLSKELTNTEKWLGSVLFFLTEKGRLPVCVEQEWVKQRYMHQSVKIDMHFQSLVKKGYLKKRDRYTYYFPNLLQEFPFPDPWEREELSYRELGLFCFFLRAFHDRIKLNYYIKPTDIDQKLSEAFGINPKWARWLYTRTFRKLELMGLIQRKYFWKRRKFRLIFLQPFPVRGNHLPPPEGLTLPEYGLLVDIFLHRLRDDSIYTPCLPERKADTATKRKLLRSLCEKGRLRQITQRTFLFLK